MVLACVVLPPPPPPPSDMWHSTLEILIRYRSEIAPNSSFLCVNKSPIRIWFSGAVAKAICYSVDLA